MAALGPKWSAIQNDINAVLEKHGMKGGGFRVTTGTHESRLNITIKNDANADPHAKAVEEFNLYHGLFSFKKEWLGMSFHYGSRTFTLRGLNLAKKKNTCVITDASGKIFIAPDAQVKRAIEAMIARCGEHSAA